MTDSTPPPSAVASVSPPGASPSEPIFRHRFTVPPSAIDDNGHVGNLVYLEWILETAGRHADAAGCTAATRRLGAAWVVREHRVVYRQPAFAGERLEVRTGVETRGPVQSRRRTEIHRLEASGGPAAEGGPETSVLLVEAWTEWVLVERSTGRLRRIPAEVLEGFSLWDEGAAQGAAQGAGDGPG